LVDYSNVNTNPETKSLHTQAQTQKEKKGKNQEKGSVLEAMKGFAGYYNNRYSETCEIRISYMVHRY
jgi:hypothetical protein